MPPRTFMRPRGRRFQTVDRINLSEHVLKINLRKGSRRKFDFRDVEEYVEAISGGRQYQYEAIRDVMTYLWAGGYQNVMELAKENFVGNDHLKERFGSEELMIDNLPLADRLSGVVHMATGTGKSFVIFAVAYLSVVLGLTRRVLVLGPSSTIIEEGLRDKFENFMSRNDWNSKLPKEYQGKAIELYKDNDAIEDNSITIENINAIYREGGIRDTLFKGVDEVLVLGDEIHHAYSHLNFNAARHEMEMDEVEDEGAGRESDVRTERLWMQFLRNNPQITRHIGFTGTPYNKDDYFADVIYDYNIRVAINEQFIKDINPIIATETDEGEVDWTTNTRFEVILKNHQENLDKYAYPKNGSRRVKPITVFYCPTQANAEKRSEEFIRFLIGNEKEQRPGLSESDADLLVRPRVICVISQKAKTEYKPQLDNIQETDVTKVGGAVEYIFSVGKLLEGWDVDNVFQIVPMEERIFNSKLLISQVLGRGLRIPRCLDKTNAYDLQQLTDDYPMLTVTNHEKFADQIRELVNAVTNSDMLIASEPLPIRDERDWRGKYHFTVFNLNYLSSEKFEDAPESKQEALSRQLILTKYDTKEDVTIFYDKDRKKYQIKRNLVTLDAVVDTLYRRFKGREYEEIRFDFGNGESVRCPTEEEIRDVIHQSMEASQIPGNGLTVQNKREIDLYFNQFLPKGKQIRIPVNVTGNITPVKTATIDKNSLRIGELERDATAFISENYIAEVDEKTKALLKYIQENRTVPVTELGQQSLGFTDPGNLLTKYQDMVRPLVTNDSRPPYIVKSNQFKTPQSSVLVHYYPEKEFVFRLIDHSKYITSWIKSPDKGFYAVDYDYWKGGKDRVLRSFNPDFFIKIDIEPYTQAIKPEASAESVANLRKLQERGIDSIIRVVEIKSDEDEDEATPAKAEKARIHFTELNKRLIETNPQDVASATRHDIKQLYIFDLLKPTGYQEWFTNLKKGVIDIPPDDGVGE